MPQQQPQSSAPQPQRLRLLLSTYTTLRPNLSSHTSTIYGYEILAYESSSLVNGLFILHVKGIDGFLMCDGKESVLVTFK